jgi:hypothetical protein
VFPEQLDLLAAFIVGLFSSVHCVGMCGSIAGALTGGLPAHGPPAAWPCHLAYNAGRIASYSVAGGAAGALGAVLAGGDGLGLLRLLMQGFAALCMLLIGLYLGGWWPVLTHLERFGGRLWRHLEPLGRRLLPLRSAWAAVPLGMLWGWLPCGLVYSALVWAAASGGAGTGAMLMLAFGAGTLPSMLATGMATTRLRGLARGRLRMLAGVLVIALGCASLVSVAWQIATGNHAPHGAVGTASGVPAGAGLISDGTSGTGRSHRADWVPPAARGCGGGRGRPPSAPQS